MILLEGVLEIIIPFMMVNVSTGVLNDIRKQMFSKLQKLPIKYFDRHTHGEIMRAEAGANAWASALMPLMGNGASGYPPFYRYGA